MSSNSKKIIQINPELFKPNKNKALIEKRDKSKIKPLISPNVIKNKFMKRIKEHKLKEIEKANKKGMDNTNEKKTEVDINKYTNEFNESIEYLQNISKQNKLNNEKIVSKEIIQKQKQHLENKTLRNPYSYASTPVNVELPEELQENLLHITPETFHVNTPTSYSQPFQLNYQIPTNVPYGILKGGKQPTFREWKNKTRKNMDSVSYSYPSSPISNQITSTGILTEREQKMNALKEKIKQKQQEKQQTPTQIQQPIQMPVPETDIMLTQNLIQKPILIPQSIPITQSIPIPQSMPIPQSIPLVSEPHPQLQSHLQSINKNTAPSTSSRFMKRITKKTIKRKYTLGKSKLKRMVSVLLKDQNTRKKIVNAQKDLKQHAITDVKKYLKTHHLIKVGTHAPNDVIRKLYESAMLAGEITNSNTETLLHNFMKEEEIV